MSMFLIHVFQPFWKNYQNLFTISPGLVKLNSCFQKPLFYSWCYCYTDQRSVGRHQEHSLVHTSWLATHGLRLHPVHSHAFGRTRSAPHLQHPPLLSLTSEHQISRVLSSPFCMLSREENMRYSFAIQDLVNFSIIDRGAYLLSNFHYHKNSLKSSKASPLLICS